MNNATWIVVVLAMHIAVQVEPRDRAKMTRPKIVGGFRVKIASVPFLLAFHGRGSGFRCGASIISASWGMSAQHCLSSGKPQPRNYFVRAGSTLNAAGGSIHRVRSFHFFKSKKFGGKSIPDHDIVLFKVSPKFRFSYTVKPAKLPVETSVPPQWLQVTGWGRTEMSFEARLIDADPTSMFVHMANVSRVEWKKCVRSNPWYEYVVDEKKHLCYGDGNADACYGDSGGPLADSDTVYGIVSFGDDCGIMPGIYTDVSYYRKWIKKITKV